MKHLLLTSVFILGFQFLYAADDTLVSKKFTYTLPDGWGLQDRLENGWADMPEPDAPYLIQDYVLDNISNQEARDKYINSWINIMKTDDPDIVKAGQENRTINGVEYTVVTLLYTKDNVKWKDQQYYTPKECGQICHGYAFTIRAPETFFVKGNPAITAFEKSLKIKK